MRKTSRLIRLSLASSLTVIVVVSLLLGSNSVAPFCPLNHASAQDSPCLAQEVTINAQQAQILELQGTNVAQKVQLLQAQGTNAALQATVNAYTPGVIITVPIV